MDSIELNKILIMIKNQRNLIKTPVIQFSYSFLPQDFSEQLSEIGKNENILIHNEIENVFGEFQQSWELAKNELENYKTQVSNEIFTKEQILEDVQNFERIVCQEQEITSSKIISSINLIKDENILAIAQQKLLNMNSLFDLYFIELKNKLNSLSKQSDAMFFESVLKEINLNECWLKKAQSRALYLFSHQLLLKISLIVDSINIHMNAICHEIERKISELKKKVTLDPNQVDSIEDFLSKFRSESYEHLNDISEIRLLQKMESELKERLSSLTDFQSIMNNFNEEKIQLIKKMDETDLYYKIEMENVMKNKSLLEDEKFEILNRLKCRNEKIIFECKEAIRNIEESQAKLVQMLLSHERIAGIDEINKTVRESMIIDGDELDNLIKDSEINKAFHRDEKGNYYTFYKDQKIFVNNFSNDLWPIVDMPQVVISDTQYLKDVIGTPLIKGLAQVVLHQPSDPIKYLAHWLLNYRQVINEQTNRLREMEELNVERERIAMNRCQYANSTKKDTSPHCMSWRGEESFADINVARFNSPNYVIDELDGE